MGRDDVSTAAVVKTVNSDKPHMLHCSIKHLIPIELNVNDKGTYEEEDTQQDESGEAVAVGQESIPQAQTLHCKAAAIIGETQQRPHSSN